VRSLLASFVLVALATTGRCYEPGDMRVMVDLAQIGIGLQAFQLDVGRYPTTSEGLAALLTCPAGVLERNWHGPYIMGSGKDPWGNPFNYACPGVHRPNSYDLYSYGEDGRSRSGGDDADDINNWDTSQHWLRHYQAPTYEAWLRRNWPMLVVIGLVIFSLTIPFRRRGSKKPAR